MNDFRRFAKRYHAIQENLETAAQRQFALSQRQLQELEETMAELQAAMAEAVRQRSLRLEVSHWQVWNNHLCLLQSQWSQLERLRAEVSLDVARKRESLMMAHRTERQWHEVVGHQDRLAVTEMETLLQRVADDDAVLRHGRREVGG
ncbi:MAG: hypothetical protein OWS03_11390 [Alicyclobacillaceae bacterium]|nr:hypothetical protein [Alicyclobacillaceae bacterium]